MKTRENELHEPIWEEVDDKYVVVEHIWRAKCPKCDAILCGGDKKEYLDDEIPNFCPECGARLKKVEE